MNQVPFMKSRLISLISVAVFCSGGCTLEQKLPERPNLIYVFPDQLRKTAMGFWNSPEYRNAITTQPDPVHTPSIDRFAEKSLVFTSMVSNCPVCSPHRGSLMTGMFPSRSGVPINCNSTRPFSSLRQDVTCLSDVLASGNYDLAYFGKWHLDFPLPNDPENPGHYIDKRWPAWDTYTPAERRHGFNYWYSYGTFDVHKNPHYFDTDGKRYDPKEYSPKHEADMIIRYLRNERRRSKKPFAIFWSMNPPHHPYRSTEDCQEEDYQLYRDRTLADLLVRANADTTMDKASSSGFYFANVTGVDREFGRILSELERSGLDRNTIVVFTSDHGETMCSHGVDDPKNQIYDEAFEVPFLIRWTGKIKQGVTDLLMGSPDIMPTMLGLMGFGSKIPATVQGTDYSSYFLGKSESVQLPSSALYLRNIDGKKDIAGIVQDYFPVARGVRTKRYTLELTVSESYQLEATKFFDNLNDPYQLINLEVDPGNPLVRQLLAEMAFWLKKSEDPWYEKKILKEWIKYE